MTIPSIDPVETRARFADDPYRPRYHYISPANQLKDPTGPNFWEGEYHLFYGHNPYGAYDDVKRSHWGHTVSNDLVHWRDLPIVLGPTPGGPDRPGCFSGGSIIWNGTPTLFYYGNPEGICIATSTDGLLTWQKHARNPLIPHGPDMNPRVFDPCVWQEGERWYALSGGSLERGSPEGTGDTAFLFESSDFLRWEYLGLFYGPGEESDCAVPDFFPLGDEHMLLFASHMRGVQYYIGAHDGGRFQPERHGRINFGEFGLESGNLCAAITMLDGSDRRIMFGWVAEGRTEKVQRRAGWSGIMCLPRVLSLGPDGGLRVAPVLEIEMLRREHVRLTDVVVSPDIDVRLGSIRGDSIEIEVEMDVSDAKELGLKVLCSPDGAEQTVISYAHKDSSVSLAVAKGSLSADMVGRDTQRDSVELAEGEPLRLHIFVDRSIVEVFDGRGLGLTKRVYPTRTDSQGLRLFAKGGDARIRSLDVWEMASVY